LCEIQLIMSFCCKFFKKLSELYYSYAKQKNGKNFVRKQVDDEFLLQFLKKMYYSIINQKILLRKSG
jgi:hypothetical protein